MIENSPNTIAPPRIGPDIVGMQLALALTAGIPLLLSFLVPIKRLGMFECPFFNITGLPGPFCGFTRSIWAISAGDWVFATVNCPLAWLLYAALISVFTWNAGCLLLGGNMTGKFILSSNRNRENLIAGIAITLILLNWIYRLSLGLT